MEALATPQHPVTVCVFAQRFSSTPRGARLARHLALHALHDWGIPYRSDASETAALIVAELATNAVTHGRVSGRDFELRLTRDSGGDAPEVPGVLRIEVSDTRGEQRPPEPGDLPVPSPDAESGRGLLLVEALADRWAVLERVPSPGKTIRAELDLP
ncbi:ATP-binding protein [Streptomyces sp. NPDC002476]|uniref:ATP-binding protein n=1 Tax=Streptomyces sp. NPDC002476 TaxID=3364648 RepID=UPI00369B2603